MTLGSVCHSYFHPRWGLARGFDHWKLFARKTRNQMNETETAPRVTQNAINLLDAYLEGRIGRTRAGDKKPFFLFLYYLDPHVLHLRHRGIPKYGRRLADRYDGEIRFTDLHIGELLEHLRETELLQNTVVVFTSDHGEAFGEHGLQTHGLHLYEHQLRVPLLIHVPGLGARRFRERVSQIDLPRTLLDLCGLEAPETYQGRSLLPALLPDGKLEPRPIYAEVLKTAWNQLKRTIIHQDWKLIHQPRFNQYRLFDLKRDPGELYNLHGRRPSKAQELRHLYEAFVATRLKIRRPLR